MPYTPTTWTNGSGQPISAANLTKIESALSYLAGGGFYLDSYSGTDDQKLTSALAAQQASGGSYNYAPVILPSRPISFNQTRTLYSGLNIVGEPAARVPEISDGAFEGAEITLGGAVSSGTASWWVGTGSIFGVNMRNFSVQGNSGSSVHQFLDVNSGTLYMCTFESLGFNFMRSVFGRKDRITGFTGVRLDGGWTINNLWDSQANIGGSDNKLWMGGFVNIGTSQSPARTGTWGDNDYMFHLQNLSKTDIGYVFATALNGWRGARIAGLNGSLAFYGGTWEGFKPTRVNGLLGGPAPGSVMRVGSGSVSFFGCSFGLFMDNPDPSENGGVQVLGGEVSMYGCHFYGNNTDTVNSVVHTGGRLVVSGSNWMDADPLIHAGRPKLASTAPIQTQSNLTASYSLVHDDSMELVPARSYRNTRHFPKAGAFAANDFAGQVVVGDIGTDTTNGRIYVCTATNGSSTSIWKTNPNTVLKAGAFVANDSANGLVVGDLGLDTTNGKLYICTATNGSTTSTWTVVGTQT